MINKEQVEELAEAIWRYYYPNGGSRYRTYNSLQDRDKNVHRNEALMVIKYLDGDAEIIPIPKEGNMEEINSNSPLVDGNMQLELTFLDSE